MSEPTDAEVPQVPPSDVTVVVLAGGASRRFGSDKLAAPLRGSTVLDETLAGLPPQWPVVLVGDRRPTRTPVTTTREDPPGGGPLAGVAAGMLLVDTDLVAVVAGDMPDAGPALRELVGLLREAPAEVAAVVATDDRGVANPLLAAYRSGAVRAHLPEPAHGRPARMLLALPHTEHPVSAAAARDVDTPADLGDLGGRGPTRRRGG